jgi:hypothetical protein
VTTHTYSDRTRVPKESTKRKLLITEREILRRICGPTKDRDGTWRNTINDELNNIIRNKNIFKLQYGPKIKLAVHVHRMTNDRIHNKLCEWKPIYTRLAGRPKLDGNTI